MPKLPPGVAKTLTSAAQALEKQRKAAEKKKEESLIAKVKTKLQQIYHGPKYHEKVVKPKPKKKKETAASLLVSYARRR